MQMCIKKLIKTKNLKQKTIAFALNLSASSLSDKLSGRTPFSVLELQRMALILNVDISTLVDMYLNREGRKK